MNRLSSSSFLQSPAAILLKPAATAAFSPQAVSSAMLPSTVRRTSAAILPNPELIEDTVARADSIPMDNLLRSPTDGKVVYPVTVLDPSTQSASFATYYTGAISAVSPAKILGLSVSLVASIVIFTYVEHDFKLSPIPLALCISLFCAFSLRFVIPARFLLLSSSNNSASTVGSHLQVAAVFSDKHRTYRAFALGILQVIYITAFAFSAARQSMTSMHMNYFSVLPPLDLVLQKFLLKIPVKTTRRALVGSVLNVAPQALALFAWDWVVGIEGIPVAVVQILWVYVIYLEQAATETAAWLASVYVGFLFSVATLIPLTIGTYVYESYYPSETSAEPVSLAVSIAVTILLGIALGVLFLTSGFLVKWSSSAHIVVLVSTAAAILISASDAPLPGWAKLTALGVMTIAWAVYVK
ncbi:hypothetical protein V1520DRAFT_386028 [Lipomyces starkeyi]|uniref:Uncharacterized protein n=1 Tax=Lipomyces starkeyi NRRL Y-11557 TaxID=675824 RepID=A0A1E3Q092_LIPST|nr:hypothetical protein LIPSTDRAFT_147128 [Lipomyces starkeyi NRRL Y-11557]